MSNEFIEAVKVEQNYAVKEALKNNTIKDDKNNKNTKKKQKI